MGSLDSYITRPVYCAGLTVVAIESGYVPSTVGVRGTGRVGKGTKLHTIYHEVWIDAPRETVFQAISTREGLDGWWGPVVSVGSEVDSVVTFDHGQGDLLRMRITDLVPDRRIAWKCVTDFTDPRNPASEWLGSRLSFDLEDGGRTGFGPIDSAFRNDRITILRFRHGGWPENSRWFGFCNYAWGVTLEALSSYCVDAASA